jgi:hypothetical protein
VRQARRALVLSIDAAALALPRDVDTLSGPAVVSDGHWESDPASLSAGRAGLFPCVGLFPFVGLLVLALSLLVLLVAFTSLGGQPPPCDDAGDAGKEQDSRDDDPEGQHEHENCGDAQRENDAPRYENDVPTSELDGDVTRRDRDDDGAQAHHDDR